MRSLTSACSRRSRFTVVETSPVNERTFQSCSCNILVFTRETCIGKESFEQARISTYHFYIRHICTAISFHDLALERGRQSSRSSPEVCLQKASRNLTRISSHFLETRGSPGKRDRLKTAKGMELVIKTRNSVNGTQISVGTFQPGKRDYPLSSSTFSGNFPVGRTEKTFSI